jgi:hypothetical protein
VDVVYWAIFGPTGECRAAGDKSTAVAETRAADFSATFGRRFPWAVARRNVGLARLFSSLGFPIVPHARICHFNVIERSISSSAPSGRPADGSR